MKGEKFFHRAFYPCFIYNRCKSAMSRAGGFSACLNCFRVTVHSVLSNTLRDAQNLC